MGAVRAAQVDDRDVEVADRGQELDCAGARLRLLDLVAVPERLAHTQPNGGLRIYDQAASVVVHSPHSGCASGSRWRASRRRDSHDPGAVAPGHPSVGRPAREEPDPERATVLAPAASSGTTTRMISVTSKSRYAVVALAELRDPAIVPFRSRRSPS